MEKSILLRENAAAFHCISGAQSSRHTLVAAATAAGVPFERDGPGPNWDFSLFSDGEKVPVSFGGDRSSSSSETIRP